jgi:hypothetical protein
MTLFGWFHSEFPRGVSPGVLWSDRAASRALLLFHAQAISWTARSPDRAATPRCSSSSLSAILAASVLTPFRPIGASPNRYQDGEPNKVLWPADLTPTFSF